MDEDTASGVAAGTKRAAPSDDTPQARKVSRPAAEADAEVEGGEGGGDEGGAEEEELEGETGEAGEAGEDGIEDV